MCVRVMGTTSSKKGKKVQNRGSGGFDPKIKDLQCFLNQPNINMVLPWLYEIYKNIVKPDSSKQQKKKKRGEEDPVLKDLECFFNQPNINMAIPWIYEIRTAVKEGGGGRSQEWDDITGRNDDIVMEEG